MTILSFDNKFIRDLPADPELENYCRQVRRSCYSLVNPVAFENPTFVAHSEEVAQLLELPAGFVATEAFTNAFSGKELMAGMEPYASCYGGHQFGNWAGQLGDGRAINLGELVNKQGQRWAVQLKGAGPTPYSRRADGFAVLRSSIREFLCSEAMFHLGVPTTRALSLVLTGEEVVRDMFYDGHPKSELGAVVCRVAPSFTRFGNFQLLAWRGELSVLDQLINYTISTDYPHLGGPSAATTIQWFKELCQRTARMIVHWLRVGFVHGVMNTDNMSILGLTIDYGPYGWLDNYDPNWTPNTTDKGRRRYRFGHQGEIALWNLAQLATSLSAIVTDVDALEDCLGAYSEEFSTGWRAMMAEKIGLREFDIDTDHVLIEELESILQLHETDMTLFYRHLANVPTLNEAAEDDKTLISSVLPAYYGAEQMTAEARQRIANWLRCYRFRLARVGGSDESRRERMNQVNPIYVLRNYLAQEAIDLAEAGDYSRIYELLNLMRRPYTEQKGMEQFSKKRPDWARKRPGCSMLSCSS
jgi:serine/tyrosine/threonine adenylyltransferase